MMPASSRAPQFAFALAAGALASVASALAPERAATIVHSNDVYAEIEPCGCRNHPQGGMARKANYLKRLADKSVLQLDAGDLLFSTLPVPCGSLAFRVCGTSGRRIMLMPMPLISCMVCWMVRPVPAPPLAQNVLPMYCSIGAPLGLVASFDGSCRPSSPNQLPQRTGNTVPFFVMRPDEFTRHTVLAVEPTVKLTAVDVVLAPPLSVAVAVAECVPLTSPVAPKLYGEEVSVFTTAPSTRNPTLAIVPFESLAVAASGTAAPEAKLWFAVGLVRLTVGAGLLPPPTVNVNAVEAVLAPPLSVAVAVAECVPVPRPVALKLYG
jgi:hypothetical protein